MNKEKWRYSTGMKVYDFLSDDYNCYNIVSTNDEKEAFQLATEGTRNYLTRTNGEITEKYDFMKKVWIEDKE